jgi:hypothetical protein
MKKEIILSVDRSDSHERGPKHIVNLKMTNLMTFGVPAGVIIGKDTNLTLKQKITHDDGQVEIMDITALETV